MRVGVRRGKLDSGSGEVRERRSDSGKVRAKVRARAGKLRKRRKCGSDREGKQGNESKCESGEVEEAKEAGK